MNSLVSPAEKAPSGMLDESKSPYMKPVTWARDQGQRETVKLQEEHL
jgi:hypothetical protein